MLRHVVLIVTFVVATAGAAEPAAMIRGGADVSGQVYTWKVTNHRDAVLEYVAFPHYHGGAFVAPEGWDTSGSTFLVGAGVPDKPGVCVARVSVGAAGIARDQSAEFRLQLAAGGAQRGLGEVTLRFADGTSAVVSGVELPQTESFGDQFVTLVGLGVIFVGWLVFRAIRARRQRRGEGG